LIKIIIAEDHALVREGLRNLLNLQSDIKVVDEAVNGLDALKKCRAQKPDILLLDVGMPKMPGTEAAKLIRDNVPETKIIILSMHEKEAYIKQAFDAGVRGYVLKTSPSANLLTAIRQVSEGEYYLCPKIRSDVVDFFVTGKRKEEQPTGGYALLSDREQQVFLLLVQGNSTVEISNILCVSPKTVEKHRVNIGKKLGTTQPIKMLQYAIKEGIIDPEMW